MGSVENFNPVVAGILETGAQIGEFVRCVKGVPGRFTEGDFYEVVSHFSRPHILSDAYQNPTKAEQKRGVAPYQIPSGGWGGRWQKVNPDES